MLREEEREGNTNVWFLLIHPLLGTWPATQACALDWESNQRSFGLQASTQSTEPHQSGLICFILSTFQSLLIFVLYIFPRIFSYSFEPNRKKSGRICIFHLVWVTNPRFLTRTIGKIKLPSAEMRKAMERTGL